MAEEKKTPPGKLSLEAGKKQAYGLVEKWAKER